VDVSSALQTLLPQQPPPAAPAASPPSPPGSSGPAPAPAGPGFGGLVTQFIQDVNQQQLDSDAAVEALATGQADNVHEVVLTAIKADLSLRMLLEIRNQLVQSYQEVMRMQL